jgi:hypothetical protein
MTVLAEHLGSVDQRWRLLMAWPTSFSGLLLSSDSDVWSALPGAEGAITTVKVTASGEVTRVSGSLATSADEQGAEIAVSAVATAETDGITVSATGSAAASGDAAATSVAVAASIDEQDAETVAVGSATATAAAEAEEDGTASATAHTDVDATGPDLVITKIQETSETDGAHPTAASFTHLEAVRIEAIQLETFAIGWTHADWSF